MPHRMLAITCATYLKVAGAVKNIGQATSLT